MEYWKFKAIDKLRDHTLKQAALINLPDEIRRLEIEAQSIKSATTDGDPVKDGGNGREDRLINNIVMREELKLMLSMARLSVDMVDRGLSPLDQDDKYILNEMYINKTSGSKERLMSKFSLAEESSLYKRTNKALLRFTIAMYGLTEY